jgi:hypothetical protein
MRIILISVLFFIQLLGQSQSFNSPQIVDTSFYQSGKIKTITFNKSAQTAVLFPGQRNLLKIVYQYDECANLRNITNIYEVYVNPNSYGIMYPNRYHEEDNLTSSAKCERIWTKPILLY